MRWVSRVGPMCWRWNIDADVFLYSLGPDLNLAHHSCFGAILSGEDSTLPVSEAVNIEARVGQCVDARLGGVAPGSRNGATSFVFILIMTCVALHDASFTCSYPFLPPFLCRSHSSSMRGKHTSHVHGYFDA